MIPVLWWSGGLVAPRLVVTGYASGTRAHFEADTARLHYRPEAVATHFEVRDGQLHYHSLVHEADYSAED